MSRCFVGLGTNLGDRLAFLRAACEALGALPQTELHACSSVWETRPVGPGTGPYLNAAVELRSELDPEALLVELARIEDQLGRVRRERWGDRSIDLDLLGVLEVDGVELRRASEHLTLPHPGVHQRDFVLTPLLELDAQLELDGQRCADSLAALSESERTLLRRFGELGRPSSRR